MNTDITFLVNSCDRYEDAWYPFFECLWHFAHDIPYPIILNTETKQFNSPHYSILCVNTETERRLTWSERLIHVLEYVHTEFVFFLLEDYFLEEVFDRERFETVVSYMKDHPDVAIVDIRPRWAESQEQAARNKIVFQNTPDSFEERTSERFNITCSPGIWRTSALKSLLRKHEDVWEFEFYSGIRAKRQNWRVVRFVTRTPAIYEYNYQVWSGMGITRGQWLPGNRTFFEGLGIEVDYSRLGILDVNSLEEIKIRHRKNLLVMLRKLPRKIRTWINRRKSLR